MAEQTDYTGQFLGEINAKIRDIAEKQRVQKDRILLIGQNLIDIKEKTNMKVLEMKKDIEILKENVEKMSSFLESISNEMAKFAKKDDLDILAKQAKMFQPLDFMRKTK